ncbi:hypothetical protein BpHYR1_048513 [Brachionus plicatilis]|uniref:Uncharacterized protein n=1 Tax=Brachionus plicatilis TaxID=10195 RepID=A0A3M7SCA5_BRAPC|nr:hypothetical protein BpHYR1_048513 [Brachionus plicatilis]
MSKLQNKVLKDHNMFCTTNIKILRNSAINLQNLEYCEFIGGTENVSVAHIYKACFDKDNEPYEEATGEFIL